MLPEKLATPAVEHTRGHISRLRAMVSAAILLVSRGCGGGRRSDGDDDSDAISFSLSRKPWRRRQRDAHSLLTSEVTLSGISGVYACGAGHKYLPS